MLVHLGPVERVDKLAEQILVGIYRRVINVAVFRRELGVVNFQLGNVARVYSVRASGRVNVGFLCLGDHVSKSNAKFIILAAN